MGRPAPVPDQPEAHPPRPAPESKEEEEAKQQEEEEAREPDHQQEEGGRGRAEGGRGQVEGGRGRAEGGQGQAVYDRVPEEGNRLLDALHGGAYWPIGEGGRRIRRPPDFLGQEQERGGYWEVLLPRELSMGEPSSRQQ